MAGVSMTFKFSLFTLAILFGLLAPSSSSEFYDEELEERDDRSAESEEDVRQYWHQHYQWQRPVPQVHHNHYGQYHYPRPVTVVTPQLPVCGNLPQCKSCKTPTVTNYQPKSPSARSTRQTNFVEEESQIEEFRSEEDYETRYYQPVKQNYYQTNRYYYQTTQPPRRQCNAVCKPPVPVTTQKPYVQRTPAYQHYQQPQYAAYGRRPYGRY